MTSSLADVFRILNQMREAGVVPQYAVGGATAVLFYAEPTRTYDLDVFVAIAADGGDALLPLSPVYEWAQARGIALQAEHLMIEGVPVQILPAWNALVETAISTARVHDYGGVPVQVVDPEHLAALALQAGGARRRERAWQLLQSGAVDRNRLQALLKIHAIPAELPADV